MKKYIFPTLMLLLVIGVAMSITHFTQKPPPEPPFIEGWDYVTRDKFGDLYYMSLPSITRDSDDTNDLNFHASIRKTYSDLGREDLIKSYNENALDATMLKEVDHEIEIMYFRERLGDKYVVGAEQHFYRADDSEIAELQLNVSTDETKLKPVPRSSIGENLYDFAFNRLKKPPRSSDKSHNE